jgi:hypothetical protein
MPDRPRARRSGRRIPSACVAVSVTFRSDAWSAQLRALAINGCSG